MKKILLVLLLTVAPLWAMGQGVFCSLTVKEACGTWISYSVDKLVIKYTPEKMVLKNSEQTVSYNVSELASMAFTDLPTAIGSAENHYTVVSLEGSKVRLNVKVGTLARVYDAMGRLCGEARVGQEGVPVFIGAPQPGIYVVRAGDEKCKVLVK